MSASNVSSPTPLTSIPLANEVIATLTFEGLPPNPNRTRGQHWSKIYASSQEWKQLAKILARNAYKGKPVEQAHLHYHISVGDNRVHDADNIEASLKSLQDGLKGIIITDDSIDHITRGFSYSREKPRCIKLTITAGRAQPQA